MAIYSILAFFVVSLLLVLHSAGSCPSSIECGHHDQQLKFPFTNRNQTACGLCTVRCEEPVLKVSLGLQEKPFQVSGFTDNTIEIDDRELKNLIYNKNCNLFSYFDHLNTSSISFTITPSITLFKCSHEPKLKTDKYFSGFSGNDTYKGCPGNTVYHPYPNHQVQLPTPGSYPPTCVAYHLPILPSVKDRDPHDAFSLLASNFSIGFHVSEECNECHAGGGQCPRDTPEFHCLNKRGGKSKLALILGAVIASVILLACLVIIWYRKKLGNYISSFTIWRNCSSDPSSKEDLEGGSVYFGVPVFSYSELEEATNNFDPSKELGDGGFGTVYFGKLRDGREVAVKRLYEHNYKRVAQFLNEIEILTRLRHRSLVTLYGCTSRHCRELLLVYEYIPNGTVADHLHGDRAKDHPLSWPTRMNIAIETASALAYLHASDIIHRDVKTNNILLDNNFCVKVADFGLSRLFPNDVSHVSTAPQGTPGYVDPEYHQCYQLTNRSDVYSFGVVLIELISSLPAVDINRHRHEINLANLAITRIQNGAFNKLIDPTLGFESDSAVERMTTSVAEVAFQCLQLEREMRPTMDEVFEALKEILEYEDEKIGEMPPPSPDRDSVVLLNSGKVPPSPDSATNRWVNSSTTSTSSG